MPQPVVAWFQFKNYSGPTVRDGVSIGHPAPGHVGRAYWLTTKVETGGFFGRVMAYDGTCMTAGPDQHIAVFPRELSEEDWKAEDDQGSLWQLFAALRGLRGSSESYDRALEDLETELVDGGFYSGPDGYLRYLLARTVSVGGKPVRVETHDLVHGNVLRETYTRPGGRVPRTGDPWEKAKRWALLWHYLTVHPDGFETQLRFGSNHLLTRVKRRQLPGLGTVENAVYGGDLSRELPPALDLAMCVYHSHSVNGPSPANRALTEALKAHPIATNPEATARDLLRRLGNNDYGRWDDDIKNGRWQRTRRYAIDSHLWPAELFQPAGIMPLDLPG